MPVREGFGLLPHVIVIRIFSSASSIVYGVLAETGYVGLGVDEGTAAIVVGTTLTVVGRSTAIVCQLGYGISCQSQVLNRRPSGPERFDATALERGPNRS